MDLYNFMCVDKFNIIIAHASLVQVWAYEKIVVIRLMGLQRDREDPTYIVMT